MVMMYSLIITMKHAKAAMGRYPRIGEQITDHDYVKTNVVCISLLSSYFNDET